MLSPVSEALNASVRAARKKAVKEPARPIDLASAAELSALAAEFVPTAPAEPKPAADSLRANAAEFVPTAAPAPPSAFLPAALPSVAVPPSVAALPVPPPPGTAVLRASLQRASQKAEHATLRAASLESELRAQQASMARELQIAREAESAQREACTAAQDAHAEASHQKEQLLAQVRAVTAARREEAAKLLDLQREHAALVAKHEALLKERERAPPAPRPPLAMAVLPAATARPVLAMTAAAAGRRRPGAEARRGRPWEPRQGQDEKSKAEETAATRPRRRLPGPSSGAAREGHGPAPLLPRTAVDAARRCDLRFDEICGVMWPRCAALRIAI